MFRYESRLWKITPSIFYFFNILFLKATLLIGEIKQNLKKLSLSFSVLLAPIILIWTIFQYVYAYEMVHVLRVHYSTFSQHGSSTSCGIWLQRRIYLCERCLLTIQKNVAPASWYDMSDPDSRFTLCVWQVKTKHSFHLPECITVSKFLHDAIRHDNDRHNASSISLHL